MAAGNWQGSPLPGCRYSTAPACLWEDQKPDPAKAFSPPPSDCPLPPLGQAVAKGLSRQDTGVGAGQPRPGKEDPQFSSSLCLPRG